jgi:hypothetical protein
MVVNRQVCRILALVLLMATLAGCGLMKPKLVNGCMTTGIDSTGKPQDSVESYALDAPALVATCEATYIKDATEVRFEWVFVDQNETIDTAKVEVREDSFLSSQLKPDVNGWTAGSYEVRIYLASEADPVLRLPFIIQ